MGSTMDAHTANQSGSEGGREQLSEDDEPLADNDRADAERQTAMPNA